MSHHRISIHNLHYITRDNKSIFNDLTLSFGQQKIAIIGRNGVGKSTLLKLIHHELEPMFGEVNFSGTMSYCPQDFISQLDKTVAEALGVAEKLVALEEIKRGNIYEKNFEILGDDWNIEESIVVQLRQFGLSNIQLNRSLKTMSGGELTRLWLAKMFFRKVDFIILDEPTNHLDLNSKQLLYSAIKQWNRGLLIVSHDRTLLCLMDKIIELTSLGVDVYGGNYEYYIKQKTIDQAALSRHLIEAKSQVKRIKEIVQQTREKHERSQAKGKHIRKTGSQSKLILDSMKERSGKTQNKLSTKEERMLKNAERRMQEVQDKVEIVHEIRIELPKTFVPSQKVIARLEKVCFTYKMTNKVVIHNFNLDICGPERIVLMGDNGSGKTTLIKLIQGELKPDSGAIFLGTSRISYLDQSINIMHSDQSILENYLLINPDVNERDARFNLASFLFRDTEVLKQASHLSGGEKLRAALACVLTSHQSPQLLILDEPTNHLDLESISVIESALNCYQGALIIISHDLNVIKNVHVSRKLVLD